MAEPRAGPSCYRPRPLQLGSHIAIVGASTLSFPGAVPLPRLVIRRSLRALSPRAGARSLPYRGARVIGLSTASSLIPLR